MVEVMSKYVEIERKQAEEESALLAGSRNAQEFSISKCIAILHKMESIPRGQRAAAYKVFRNADNREIFINSAAEDEESAPCFFKAKWQSWLEVSKVQTKKQHQTSWMDKTFWPLKSWMIMTSKEQIHLYYNIILSLAIFVGKYFLVV